MAVNTRVGFWGTTASVPFVIIISIHHHPFITSAKNPDFGRVFQAPAGQVVLRHELGFECLKTQLAVFLRTQKSALRDGLDVAGKTASGCSLAYQIGQIVFAYVR